MRTVNERINKSKRKMIMKERKAEEEENAKTSIKERKKKRNSEFQIKKENKTTVEEKEKNEESETKDEKIIKSRKCKGIVKIKVKWQNERKKKQLVHYDKQFHYGCHQSRRYEQKCIRNSRSAVFFLRERFKRKHLLL